MKKFKISDLEEGAFYSTTTAYLERDNKGEFLRFVSGGYLYDFEEYKIEDGSLVLADKGVIRLTAREVEKFIESKM